MTMPVMAYDQARSEMVLMGWEVGSNFTRASFRWTGTGWTRSAESGGPLTVGFALSYDPATKGLLLFGGFNQSGSDRDETWQRMLDGWKVAAPAHHPAGTGFLSTSATPDQDGVLLLAGCQLWRWDGTDWSQTSAGVGVPGPYLFRTRDGTVFVFGLKPSPSQETNEGVWRFS